MKTQRSNYSTDKSERLEARLSKVQKELIQHAADLSGRSLTDFVLSVTQEAARKVIREHDIISLTAHESKKFVDLLMSAPPPNAALRKAASKHRTLFEDDN